MPEATTQATAAALWAEIARLRRLYRRNSRTYYGAYSEAWRSLKEHGERVRQQLRAAGLETRVDHAYTPTETGSYGGSDHVVVLADVQAGRFKRSAGDALCRPASAFWGLEHTNGGPATCKTCIERAEKLLTRLDCPKR